MNEEDVKAAAEGADEWAEYAARFGLELTYHIHTNLLVDSIDHWKLYMDHLRTAGLCIDVSHAQLWGYDPAASLRDFRGQLNYVHLQDWAATTPPRRRVLRSHMVPGGRTRERGLSRRQGRAGRDRL